MKLFRIRTYEDYTAFSERISETVRLHISFLESITPPGRIPFTHRGYSYTAEGNVDFIIDYQHTPESAPIFWRERVCCPKTDFNNRVRAAFHLFDIEMAPYPDIDLYVTEQMTPIYKYFSDRYPRVRGSEFLRDGTPLGEINKSGIRNEDLCALTFDSASFDAIVSLDIFEHIADYRSAFRECARVLRPGGRLMWSVPFAATSRTNAIRATVRDGKIEHILPAEYHGDHLSGDGILCFQNFGWEMLDDVRAAGFGDVYAISYQSKRFGYLGADQFMFFAFK